MVSMLCIQAYELQSESGVIAGVNRKWSDRSLDVLPPFTFTPLFFGCEYNHQVDSLSKYPTNHAMDRSKLYRGFVCRVFDLVETQWSIL